MTILMGVMRKTYNIKKGMIERKTYIGCWYGYYETYPWKRIIYEISLWL
jgi:hypothetical protein